MTQADFDRHIDLPDDPARACLLYGGVPVWAIVRHIQGADGDPQPAAAEYDLPLAQVRAALRYYRKHKRIIDARLTLIAG